MIGKAFRYKGLDFTDDAQFASQQGNGYSFILQDVIRDTTTRTEVGNKANFHGGFSSETLAGTRLFTFRGVVVGKTKALRHEGRKQLVQALQPEGNPNIQTRGFYQLQFQDDGGNERFAMAKVFTMPEPRNGLDDPVIQFRFELLSESEKIYGEQHIVSGGKAFSGGVTLPTTLPTPLSGFVGAIPVTNNGDWIAPCKINIVGTATNPKILNLQNGNKYRLDKVTTNLVLDNRNINNNPLENFIVTDNGQNVKQFRNSGADIFLQPGVNNIAVLTDVASENPTVTITYRDTYIY